MEQQDVFIRNRLKFIAGVCAFMVLPRSLQHHNTWRYRMKTGSLIFSLSVKSDIFWGRTELQPCSRYLSLVGGVAVILVYDQFIFE